MMVVPKGKRNLGRRGIRAGRFSLPSLDHSMERGVLLLRGPAGSSVVQDKGYLHDYKRENDPRATGSS